MNILIIDNGTSYINHLVSLLDGNSIDIVKYTNKVKNLGSYDLIILSGGHSVNISIDNEEILSNEINIIKTSNIPVIGICYGCELIAYTYGCVINKGNKVKGIRRIKQLIDNDIFKNIDISKLEVFENHSSYISELSSDLIGLAQSDEGYEVIKHRDKPIIGLQFHPEMIVDQSVGDEIFKNCINQLINI